MGHLIKMGEEMGQFVGDIEFIFFTCECGILYALTRQFINCKQNNHETFYCPNGCTRHYPAKTDKEILQEKLDKTKQRLVDEQECCIQAQEGWRATERSLSATKGVVTKMRKQQKE